MLKFPVSSEDCLVVVAVHKSNSLREAARVLQCDAGGLLRRVRRIAEDHGVLQKNEGRWVLTAKGVKLVAWAQESILSQNRVLHDSESLRLASTFWLTERVLVPASRLLRKSLHKSEIQYVSAPLGFEAALRGGDCDFVVVCHPPEDPGIGHKRICPEPWSIVISESLIGRKRTPPSPKDLAELPFLRHHDLNPASLLPFKVEAKELAPLSFDHLVGLRAALVAGWGWSYVPTALVEAEIKSHQLRELRRDHREDRHICLWFRRNARDSKKKLAAVENWLKETCRWREQEKA